MKGRGKWCNEDEGKLIRWKREEMGEEGMCKLQNDWFTKYSREGIWERNH